MTKWDNKWKPILCIILITLCYNAYAQTKSEILDYIDNQLYEDLMQVEFSTAILDAISAFVCEDFKAFEQTMNNIDALKNNDKFQSAIEYAATDKEIRAALRKTALRALKRKWRDLFSL